jgi:hypothetical protein
MAWTHQRIDVKVNGKVGENKEECKNPAVRDKFWDTQSQALAKRSQGTVIMKYRILIEYWDLFGMGAMRRQARANPGWLQLDFIHLRISHWPSPQGRTNSTGNQIIN